MNYRVECPDCGSHDTERVHIEWLTDGVDEVRICNDCPVQYSNKFRDPLKQIDMRAEEA